jgi:hypothetical protein
MRFTGHLVLFGMLLSLARPALAQQPPTGADTRPEPGSVAAPSPQSTPQIEELNRSPPSWSV